jgi:hypothetical protein
MKKTSEKVSMYFMKCNVEMIALRPSFVFLFLAFVAPAAPNCQAVISATAYAQYITCSLLSFQQLIIRSTIPRTVVAVTRAGQYRQELTCVATIDGVEISTPVSRNNGGCYLPATGDILLTSNSNGDLSLMVISLGDTCPLGLSLTNERPGRTAQFLPLAYDCIMYIDDFTANVSFSRDSGWRDGDRVMYREGDGLNKTFPPEGVSSRTSATVPFLLYSEPEQIPGRSSLRIVIHAGTPSPRPSITPFRHDVTSRWGAPTPVASPTPIATENFQADEVIETPSLFVWLVPLIVAVLLVIAFVIMQCMITLRQFRDERQLVTVASTLLTPALPTG